MEFESSPKIKSIGRNLFDNNKIQLDLSGSSINKEITDNDGLVGVVSHQFIKNLQNSKFGTFYTKKLKEVLDNQYKSVDELVKIGLLLTTKPEHKDYIVIKVGTKWEKYNLK